MNMKKWFGGALVLGAALSLALAGSVVAQERGYGAGSGGYSSGPSSQKDKKLSPPAKCETQGPVGICAPKSASPQPKPSTGPSPEKEKSK